MSDDMTRVARPALYDSTECEPDHPSCNSQNPQVQDRFVKGSVGKIKLSSTMTISFQETWTSSFCSFMVYVGWCYLSLSLLKMHREALLWDSAVCLSALCFICLSALANCLENLCQGMWTRLHTGAALEWLQGKLGSALCASLGLPPRQQGVQLCLQPLQLHRIYIEASGASLLGMWWLGTLVDKC